MRSTLLGGGALLANVGCLIAFLRLPWAGGAGPLAGIDLSGPELARLLRSTDLIIGGRLGGPTAVVLVAALYAVPLCALGAGVLIGGAPLVSRPTLALRAAAALTGCIALVCVALGLLLAVGPHAGASLRRTPSVGAVAALAAAMLGAILAARAGRRMR